jgi:alpha-ketoglutarate-dependent taurine dioxygenase
MKKLPQVARRRVEMAPDELVEFEPLVPGRELPLLVRPARVDLAVDLAAWAAAHRDELEERLHRHGGLLFRGFQLGSLEAFQSFARAAAGELLDYRQRATPRSRVTGNVYTSTDYPADQPIELHNESCYAKIFPLRIFFYCDRPADEGGETPIADCRQVLDRLPADVRRRFELRGVTYVRNFREGVGHDWREVFDVGDRADLAERCRVDDVDWEWRTDGSLVTRQVRPAVALHPVTGESVWFNQATAFHVSTLPPSLREGLIALFGVDGVPKTTLYGDGGAIEPEALADVRLAYERSTVRFHWQKDDVLMLDNMLAAHGRMPYTGARRIIVAMARPHSLERPPQ